MIDDNKSKIAKIPVTKYVIEKHNTTICVE